MKQYADLADLPEDKRINAIGNAAMKGGRIAFVTDADPGKAERYIAKLRERFPEIVVIARGPGPVANVVTVCVERRAPAPSHR